MDSTPLFPKVNLRNLECVEYGTSTDENDTLVIRVENGELYILLGNQINDIKELNE